MGLALALIFGLYSLAPEGWPKMPAWLILAGIGIGILLMGIGGGLVIADRRNESVQGQIAAFPKWPDPYTPISVVGRTLKIKKLYWMDTIIRGANLLILRSSTTELHLFNSVTIMSLDQCS